MNFYKNFLSQIHQRFARSWQLVDNVDANWIYFFPPDNTTRTQGWKLHISLSSSEIEEAFSVMLPLLFSTRSSFKIPGSMEVIVKLNSGELGTTQIGKIITIYPNNDLELANVLHKLNSAYPHSRGPLIAGDLQVSESGMMGIRYGSFSNPNIDYDEFGRPDFYLKNPFNGTSQADKRDERGAQVFLIEPPVPVFSPKTFSSSKPIIIKDQAYILLSLLSKSYKSRTFLALDQQNLRAVVIKIGKKGVYEDVEGNDMTVKLKNEFDILNILIDGDCNVPKPIAYNVSHHDVFLVMEDVKGSSMDKLSMADRRKYFPQVIQQVISLHRLGILHRDIKLANIIVSQDQVYLIDFELSSKSDNKSPLKGGTRNYQNELKDAEYDYYALGVTFLHVVTNYDPAFLMVKPMAIVKILHEIGRHEDALLAEILLDGKIPSNEIIQAIQKVEVYPKYRILPELDEQWFKNAFIDVLVSVSAFIDSKGNCRNNHLFANFEMQGINIGAAGILLGGICLLKTNNDKQSSIQLKLVAEKLITFSGFEKAHGLFTGNAGIALSLVAAFHHYKEEKFKVAAKRFFLIAVSDNVKDNDFFSGKAGIVYSGCLIADILKETWPLETVLPLYTALKAEYQEISGVITWSPSSMMETDDPFLGAAHGCAGIAVALHTYAKQIGDGTGVELAIRTLKSIFDNCKTDLGILRTCSSKASAPNNTWCHGMLGYLWAILSCEEPSLFKNEIEWCVSLMERLPLLDNTTYCHGIAGRLDVLNMLQQIPEHAIYAKEEMHYYMYILKSLAFKYKDHIAWSSENPETISPDLWVGFTGPATALSLSFKRNKFSFLKLNWLKNED